MLVQAEGSSHWYDRQGKPQYSRPNKAKPGQMRDTNLRDARKENLLPSVTTITKIIARPQLEAWKIEQGILASLTLPRADNETDDDFARRVVQDARSVSRDAADLGTEFHHYSALYDTLGVRPTDDGKTIMDPRMPQMVAGYILWHQKHLGGVTHTEQCFAAHGYGGRDDLLATTIDGRTVLIDKKTKATRQGKRIEVYDEQGMQLAACANGLKLDKDALLWNVFVSTTEMGRCEVHDWTEQRDRYWQMFQTALSLWCQIKKYDPRKAVEDAE